MGFVDRGEKRDDIGKYFGFLFSCGMTTFLRLPEAQLLAS
jgi:hypothetical protein